MLAPILFSIGGICTAQQESTCKPLIQCTEKTDNAYLCTQERPKAEKFPDPWREHPAGLAIGDGVDAADVEAVKPLVRLDCGETVTGVRLGFGGLIVDTETSASDHRGREIYFELSDDGSWTPIGYRIFID